MTVLISKSVISESGKGNSNEFESTRGMRIDESQITHFERKFVNVNAAL